jgi:hypothetical protein
MLSRRIALLAAALLALFATDARAASRVWISEFAVIGVSGQAQIAVLPSLVNQPVFDITAGVLSSATFNAQTKYIRIMCEVQCAVKAGGTATTADTVLPALFPEYFGVAGGAVSVILAP